MIAGPPRKRGANHTAKLPEQVHGTVKVENPPNGATTACAEEIGNNIRKESKTDIEANFISSLYTINPVFIWYN
ncbi:MAG: hypothetical protein A2758_00615 [Candidatus Zambryskibacteria bacterium RIFCSPHIGHO2_01_FULL_49_18]|uniref:Uncharacterized protein n=2 Tax=Candidatus Zambryskiibacteriota TaxID=1817925 RepID=A0A1G2T449_9BACT|nr:MAG: hypothetical protein A2758_00615 [Candidatus Zambryskibacteria bacterium RIFCSPHIGHO2_01_FULL_49_18]OHB05926.1 MAG: hypothetical protein A3A26_03200 [Candidatus Zambryskibacteria bacterium RIFCSPLOWO2_01_FULL_47_14]